MYVVRWLKMMRDSIHSVFVVLPLFKGTDTKEHGLCFLMKQAFADSQKSEYVNWVFRVLFQVLSKALPSAPQRYKMLIINILYRHIFHRMQIRDWDFEGQCIAFQTERFAGLLDEKCGDGRRSDPKYIKRSNHPFVGTPRWASSLQTDGLTSKFD
jgi:hypothetical protein